MNRTDRSPPRLTPSACTACGACVRVCPHELLFRPKPDSAPVRLSQADRLCVVCGHCGAVCPSGAMSFPGPGEAAQTIPAARDPEAPERVLEWLRLRRSVRRYAACPPSRTEIERLLEAARYSPTGHNGCGVGCAVILGQGARQRLRQRVCAVYRTAFRLVRLPVLGALLGLCLGGERARELRAALPGAARAAERMEEGKDPLFHGAPAFLLFHAAVSETAEADCVLAAGQVSLLAPSLGLGTCHIGYASAALRRFPRLARGMGVPPKHRVYAVLTLGRSEHEWRRLVPRPALRVSFR